MPLEWDVYGRGYAKTKCNRFQVMISPGPIYRVFATTTDPLNPLKQIGETRNKAQITKFCNDEIAKKSDGDGTKTA